MSSPLKSVFKKEHSDEISNHSVNPVFSEVVSAFMSRRRFLQMGMVAGAAVSFPYLVKPENAFAAKANPQHYLKRCHWASPAFPFRQQTLSPCRKAI